MDLDSLEQQKEDLEYDIDNAGEDRGMYESELESVEDKIKIVEKLLEEKDAVRDALIRTALKKAENSGNYSDKTIQRYFERAANDAFGVFIKIR
jgi:chromosome segregation ATPase